MKIFEKEIHGNSFIRDSKSTNIWKCMKKMKSNNSENMTNRIYVENYVKNKQSRKKDENSFQ